MILIANNLLYFKFQFSISCTKQLFWTRNDQIIISCFLWIIRDERVERVRWRQRRRRKWKKWRRVEFERSIRKCIRKNKHDWWLKTECDVKKMWKRECWKIANEFKSLKSRLLHENYCWSHLYLFNIWRYELINNLYFNAFHQITFLKIMMIDLAVVDYVSDKSESFEWERIIWWWITLWIEIIFDEFQLSNEDDRMNSRIFEH